MMTFNIVPTDWKLGAGSRLETLPDGTVAVIAGYGSEFSKDLGVSPQQLQANPNHPGYYLDGIYTLAFSIQNMDLAYPGYYTAEVNFGTQELCESSGWGARPFTQITFDCFGHAYIVADKSEPGGGPVQGANPLVVRFKVDGWAILFKDVSLTFTPTN